MCSSSFFVDAVRSGSIPRMDFAHRAQALFHGVRPSTAVSGLGVVVGVGLYWQHSARQHATLHSQHDNLVKEVATYADDTRDTLQKIDEAVNKGIKARDNSLQRMDMQNIEQTRSIDRLITALKSCSIKLPPELSRSTAVGRNGNGSGSGSGGGSVGAAAGSSGNGSGAGESPHVPEAALKPPSAEA